MRKTTCYGDVSRVKHEAWSAQKAEHVLVNWAMRDERGRDR